MEERLQDIALAISQISTGNSFKDYLFPVILGGLSVWVAHKLSRHLGYIDDQKRKLNIANQATIAFQNTFNALVGIKGTYTEQFSITELGADPRERAARLPEIFHSLKPIDFDVSKLSFIFLIPDEVQKEYDPYGSVAFIADLMDKVGIIFSALDKRNAVVSDMLDRLAEVDSGLGSIVDLPLYQVYGEVGRANYLGYLQTTEFLLKNIDLVMIEIHNLLCNFPVILSYSIDLKPIESYGSVIHWALPKKDALKPVSGLGIDEYAAITGMAKEDIKTKLFVGADDLPEICLAPPLDKSAIDINSAIKRRKILDGARRHHGSSWS